MRSSLTLFAAACAASFALSMSAGAATVTPVLSFGETTTNPQLDFVRAVTSGSTTTLTTNGPATGTPPTTNSIPITFGQIGTLSGPAAAALTAFETFMPNLSGTSSAITGTIIFSSGANGTGTNYLTVQITNGMLTPNGQALNLSGSDGSGSTTVTLTSNFGAVTSLIGTSPVAGVVAIGLTPTSNVPSPPSGSLFVNGGTVSAISGAIPEPASFLSASTAILAGLGCFGWSRRKSSKA